MKTLIDLFREFSLTAGLDEYTASSRILYYSLLYCWNEQRRPDVTSLATKQLYTLTGLPETTFRDAFGYLADRGWVKRVKSRRRGIFAWIMREDRGNGATPAGFLSARAQRNEKEKVEEPPPKAAPQPTTKEAEANVQSISAGSSCAISPISDLDGILRATSTSEGLHYGELPDDF